MEFLNQQVHELKNQLVQKLTESKKKSIIEHNIPHKFVPIKIKFSTLCCNRISFGQKAKKCQDSSSIVHADCNLANFYGFKVDYVRNALHENNTLSQSNNIEPSAPEESSSNSEDEIEDLKLEFDTITKKGHEGFIFSNLSKDLFI